MFISRKPSPEDLARHDVRLLGQIYSEVALSQGIVTIDVAQRDASAGDGKDMDCKSCGESGHGQRDCLQPLFCGSCKELGHATSLAPRSTLERPKASSSVIPR